MSDKPRRAWFQIHLSTAIVMMFAAGGFLYVNSVPEYVEIDNTQFDPRLKLTTENYGWPCVMMNILRYHGPENFTVDKDYEVTRVEYDGKLLWMRSTLKPKDPFDLVQTPADFRPFQKINTPLWRNREKAVCNLLVAMGCLAFLVCLLEFFARRREARAP